MSVTLRLEPAGDELEYVKPCCERLRTLAHASAAEGVGWAAEIL